MALAPKNLRPLIISVKAKNWRQNDGLSQVADAAFESVRKKALERDRHTCQFCGFSSYKWQEIHHVDDDHHNNSLDNLVTACMFCHLVHHIGYAGQKGEAVLIWMPELSQDKVNHLIRTILVAQRWAEKVLTNKTSKTTEITMAKNVLEAAGSIQSKMMARTAKAKEMIGTDSPNALGDVLLQIAAIAPEKYDARAEYLNGIRLLPTGLRVDDAKQDNMPKILEDYLGTGGAYAGIQPRSWIGLLKQYVDK